MNSDENSNDIPAVHEFDDDAEIASPSKRTQTIDYRIARQYQIPTDLVKAAETSDVRSKILKPYAFRMYIEHFPASFISRKLDVPHETIRHWVKTDSWAAKRDEVNAKFMNSIIQMRVQQFAQLTGNALDVITKAVSKLKDSSEVSIRDAESVSRIFQNLDRVLRLSTGQATDITEQRSNKGLKLPKNAAELLEIIKSDPFMDTAAPEKQPELNVTYTGPDIDEDRPEDTDE